MVQVYWVQNDQRRMTLYDIVLPDDETRGREEPFSAHKAESERSWHQGRGQQVALFALHFFWTLQLAFPPDGMCLSISLKEERER